VLILYTSEGGTSQIQLHEEQQTVWLSQLEMATLFDATKQNISLHLKNLYEDGELRAGGVVKKSLTTAVDTPDRSTVKQSLTVAAERLSRPSTEESSLVRLIQRDAVMPTSHGPLFPRRRESSVLRAGEGSVWIPAFAGMTSIFRARAVALGAART